MKTSMMTAMERTTQQTNVQQELCIGQEIPQQIMMTTDAMTHQRISMMTTMHTKTSKTCVLDWLEIPPTPTKKDVLMMMETDEQI